MELRISSCAQVTHTHTHKLPVLLAQQAARELRPSLFELAQPTGGAPSAAASCSCHKPAESCFASGGAKQSITATECVQYSCGQELESTSWSEPNRLASAPPIQQVARPSGFFGRPAGQPANRSIFSLPPPTLSNANKTAGGLRAHLSKVGQADGAKQREDALFLGFQFAGAFFARPLFALGQQRPEQVIFGRHEKRARPITNCN